MILFCNSASEEKPISKKALKKQQKEAEKAAKKAQRKAEVDAEQQANQQEDFSKDYYGDMKMIQSTEKLGTDLNFVAYCLCSVYRRYSIL